MADGWADRAGRAGRAMTTLTAPFLDCDVEAPRRLSPAEILDVLRDLGRDAETYRALARHTRHERWFRRLSVTDCYDVWLLGWHSHQGVDLHDHGGSAGGFVVLQGELLETSMGREHVGVLSERRVCRRDRDRVRSRSRALGRERVPCARRPACTCTRRRCRRWSSSTIRRRACCRRVIVSSRSRPVPTAEERDMATIDDRLIEARARLAARRAGGGGAGNRARCVARRHSAARAAPSRR